ncbi:beta-1,4-N-acetylgalactosaminyltransferase 3-like [Oculina patagonica]
MKFINGFQIEDNTVDYGRQIFGFVRPPDSGLYRFAIASDDESELWLSRSEDPNEKELIARVFKQGASAWTRMNELNKFSDQMSEHLKLREGSKYYIEVVHKQGVGNGFVQVFWKSFKDTDFQLISSDYLSSYTDNTVNVSTRRFVLHSVFSGRYRQNAELKSKTTSRQSLQFYFLPLIPKDDYLPWCDYKTSFVLNSTVKANQGRRMVHKSMSSVFPADDTNMGAADQRPESTWPNQAAERATIQAVVDKIVTSLRMKTSKNYFLKRIHKVTQKSDPVHGDRYSVDLELGLDYTDQSFRLSEHVYDEKVGHRLCFPRGMNWKNNATVYFILPVKDQGRWVYHFINELTVASLLTGNKNFHVMVADFESQDIDMAKAFNTSLLRSRHTIVPLKGKFYKTLALNEAVERVPSAHDLLFLFDLHIDVPIDIMDSVRKNTIEGHLVYAPIVGRLRCGSTFVDHRGYWEGIGYGLLSVYKSDWVRFGGMNNEDFKYKWGGEDWDLLNRVINAKLEVERIKHPGLYHHYHTKQKAWN